MPFRLQLKYWVWCLLGLVIQQAIYEDGEDEFCDDEGYPVELNYGQSKSDWYDLS